MTNHPITPPQELVQEWFDKSPLDRGLTLATKSARWGANQELDACCEWVESNFGQLPTHNLRQFRRPKPPSLKEQALSLVEQHENGWRPSPKDWDTIRKALEAL